MMKNKARAALAMLLAVLSVVMVLPTFVATAGVENTTTDDWLTTEGDNTVAAVDTVNYTIEMDVLSLDGSVSALAIPFGAVKTTVGESVMWQVRQLADSYTLTPWKYDTSVNWKWTTVPDSVVTFATDPAEYAAMEDEDGFHLKIHVTDTAVLTYVDDVLISTVTTEQLGFVPGLGHAGLRTAINEIGTVDNVVITDYRANSQGAVLASYDFSESIPDNSNSLAVIENGVYTAPVDMGLDYLVDGLASAAPLTVDYTIDLDVKSLTKAYGFFFGDKAGTRGREFMWQIQDTGSSYKLAPFHVGGWLEIDDATVMIAEGERYTEMKANGFHLQIRVTDDIVRTFVDGVPVSGVTTRVLGYVPALGNFGVRGATNEGAVLDNLEITDYTADPAGNTLASYDFEATIPSLPANTYVEDGVFVSPADKWVAGYPVSGLNAEKFTVNYTLDVDVVSIDSSCVGLMFGGAYASDKTLMWQFFDKGTYFELYPFTGTNWVALTSYKAQFGAEDYAAMKENGFHVQMHVTDQWVKTYVDDTLISTLTTAQIGITPELGYIGMRCADNEGGKIDNIKLVDHIADPSGKTLADYDFETNIPTFIIKKTYSCSGTVTDGVFVAPSGTGADGEWLEGAFVEGLPSVPTCTVNYTVDMDVKSIDFDSSSTSGRCIGIMFGAAHAQNSMMMWQVHDKDTYYELYPFTGTNWTALTAYKVQFGADNYTAMKENGFHIQIHVTNLWVKTYVDGTLVSTMTAAQIGLTPDIGFVGMRNATNEGGKIDNLVVTDYMQTKDGNVLVNYDFETSIPTFTNKSGSDADVGTIVDGVFVSQANLWMQGTFVENLKALAAVPLPDPLVLNYDHGRVYILSKKDTSNGQTYELEVAPDAGYQLKAGSLYGVSAEGSAILPTRVNYRAGGDGYRFTLTVPAGSTLHASFYAPTAQDANIAFLGTSYNMAEYGVRFVHRAYVQSKNGTPYVVVDGKEYAVKDYGMLLALAATVGEDTLSLEMAANRAGVKKLSAYQEQVYFDYCADYIDMSVCITDINKVKGGESMRIAARCYVELSDGTVLYTNTAVSSFEEATYGVKTVTFSELVTKNYLIRHGRAGLVGDEWQMDWNNTGFEVQGQLSGDVELEVVNYRNNIAVLNVLVDDDAVKVVEVPSGTSIVTLASNLSLGDHTIKVISGSEIWTGNLSVTKLRYVGELYEVAEDNSKLRILALGDSLTCGWGLDGTWSGGSDVDRIVRNSNSYKTYAAITARNLDAYLDVVARSSQVTSTVHGYVDKLNLRMGAPAWDWENNQQDIVLINLGSNDETQDAYTMETTEADLKALMTDMRAKNPNAYIIFLYGMTRKAYESAYIAAVESMTDAGDEKVFMLEFEPNADGGNGHPSAAAHAAYAEKLTQFIKENCTELFGHETVTTNVAALETAGTVLRNGRTALSGTNMITKFANSGMTLSGYLYGDITMSMSADTSEQYTPGEVLYYNVVVDGDVENATLIEVKNGRDTYALVKNLRRGYHTIELTRGTASNYGTATLHEVTYTGTLQPITRKALKIEFIGDSITNAEGTIVRNDLADNYYVERHNSLNSYAAQVARALDADLSVMASSGISAQRMLSTFPTHPAAEAKDIVVINLGTNDMGWPYFDLEEMEADGRLDTIRTNSAALIDLARSTYGEDVQVIWAYGMMYEQGMTVLQDVVDTYNAENPGANVLFCNMFSVADTTGYQTHPSQQGQDNAAAYLLQFIRENCADILAK